MPFSQKIPFDDPPADELASQSTQHPQILCVWTAYVPQSGSSPSPLPRRAHTLTETANAAGDLFLFGGLRNDDSCVSGNVYVFSSRGVSTTLLQTSGEASVPRFAHGAALFGTTLLVCGGVSHKSVLRLDLLHLLNLETREWSRVLIHGPGPGYRYYHTTKVVGSKLFIFGGLTSGGRTTNDMWTLDLNCLKSRPVWESYEPISGNEKPLPRVSHASVTTKDCIIIFGGYSGQHYYNDTWSFDISTRKWTELRCTGSIPSPRSGHAAVLVDGVIYVFGGYTGKTYSDDLIALQLSTQRWFKFHNVGPSPQGRSSHTMASDGTRVFVLGGNSTSAQTDDISFVHVFDTKHIKFPEPERNAVDPNEKTKQLPWKSSTGPSSQEQPQHLVKPRDAVLVEMLAKLDELLLSRDQQIGQIEQYEREYASVRAKLQTKDSELEAVRLRLTEAEKGWTSLDELAVSRDQQVGQHEKELASVRAKLKAKDQQVGQHEKELASVRARLKAKDQQVGQHEKELASVCAKLEAMELELEAVRLRLMDAEKGWTESKAEVDTLRAQIAAGSENTDEDQVTRGLMERMRAIEAQMGEMASKRWNVKSIEEMECRNEG